jgi:protein-export membrane protein SecD
MLKHRAKAVYVLVIALAIGYFVYSTNNKGNNYEFRLGLDLSGGSHLVYKADVSKIQSQDIGTSMGALRDVIERRINIFGVSEPIVQVEKGGALSNAESQYKIIVELPGISNIEEAVKAIGATPRLEFKLASESDIQSFNKTEKNSIASTTELENKFGALFKPIGLDGTMVSRASLEFNTTTNIPAVGLSFNSDGRKVFGNTTKDHVGDFIGIFLDGKLISYPVIREAITNGKAQISGNFTTEEASKLVRDLNFGALPVPISLISTQTVGPSLGADAVNGGLLSGIIAFVIIAIFLIVWYRLPGLVAGGSTASVWC